MYIETECYTITHATRPRSSDQHSNGMAGNTECIPSLIQLGHGAVTNTAMEWQKTQNVSNTRSFLSPLLPHDLENLCDISDMRSFQFRCWSTITPMSFALHGYSNCIAPLR